MFGEYLDVFVEAVAGTDVAPRHAWLPRSACCQLTLLEDQIQQWEQRVAEKLIRSTESSKTAFAAFYDFLVKLKRKYVDHVDLTLTEAKFNESVEILFFFAIPFAFCNNLTLGNFKIL